MKTKPTMPTINRKHPLARGLAAAWPLFEKGGASALDIAASRFNSTLTGTWSKGAAGPQFAPSAGGSVGNVLAGTRNMTVSAIFRHTSTGARQEIISKEGGTSVGWQLAILGDDHAEIGVFNATDGYPYIEGTAALVTRTAPYHIVGVRDDAASLLRIYVGGIQEASVNSGSATPGTDTAAITLGATPTGGNIFAGGLIDIRVWLNRALNANEIAHLYADPWGLYRPAAIKTLAKKPTGGAAYAPILARGFTEAFGDARTFTGY